MKDLLDLIHMKPKRALELGSGMGFDAIGMNHLGISVDAIELVGDLVDFSRLIQDKQKSQVNFIQGDFLTYEPKAHYDLVYYMDGFGVSKDEDQIKLLQRIESWLSPSGKCLIEVYNPSYWKKAVGVKMQLSDKVSRVYDYDHQPGAFLDTWTEDGTGFSYTQSLKCYSLEDFKDLLKQTSLTIETINPGGAMDYEKMVYMEKTSLEDCMMYQVVLVKTPSKQV
jgi:SAM-dependent methyltransferase